MAWMPHRADGWGLVAGEDQLTWRTTPAPPRWPGVPGPWGHGGLTPGAPPRCIWGASQRLWGPHRSCSVGICLGAGVTDACWWAGSVFQRKLKSNVIVSGGHWAGTPISAAQPLTPQQGGRVPSLAHCHPLQKQFWRIRELPTPNWREVTGGHGSASHGVPGSQGEVACPQGTR